MHSHTENNNSTELAEKMYEPSDYEKTSFLSQGLAMTHEQVSDDYMEGTNDGKIDQYADEKNVEIPRQGYENMFKK